MKVLLANPPWVKEDRVGFRSNVRWPFTISKAEFERGNKASYHFPIYQAYTLAVLELEGFDVAAIDCSVSGMDVKEFVRAVKSQAPDLVVLEISTPTFDLDMATAAALKEKSALPIALVGTHASIYHREIVSGYSSIDFVVRGEYEYTVLDLAAALREGRDIETVQGLTFRRNGEVVVNPDRPRVENLDSIPFPARDHFEWRKYHEPTYFALPWITMITSRGCPYRCAFCSWPQTMYGHRYRVRSAKNVVDEMEHCVEKYGPGEIFFDDDTFTIGKTRVMEICREIRDRDLRVVWSCMGRTDTVDDEMLADMFNAGCRKIKFGVETGSKRIMATIQKGLDLDKVATAFQIARSVGMEVHGTFMIGLPGETRDTVRETVELACSIPMDSVQFSIATPFPGTDFYEQCRQNRWLVTEEWENYDGNFGSVVSYPQLSKVEIEELHYFANQEYEMRRKRDPILVRFKNEMRRAGVPGAVRRAAESARLRVSRNLGRLRHAVEDSESIELDWDWYPYDPDEEGRPVGAHSTLRILVQSLDRTLKVTARSARELNSSGLWVFDGDTLLSKLDLNRSWQEFTVELPGTELLELSLRAEPTVPCRKGAYIRHYGAVVKNILVQSR
jgi:anaerobic magnesium-protoporphyrin IX monomethyl ester cyclase